MRAGTRAGGGASGSGTVFELTENGSGGYTETVLHSGGGGAAGSNPTDALIEDSAGNLYGGASGGGTAFKFTLH